MNSTHSHLRGKILEWFLSLSVEARVNVCTWMDACWVQTIRAMISQSKLGHLDISSQPIFAFEADTHDFSSASNQLQNLKGKQSSNSSGGLSRRLDAPLDEKCLLLVEEGLHLVADCNDVVMQSLMAKIRSNRAKPTQSDKDMDFRTSPVDHFLLDLPHAETSSTEPRGFSTLMFHEVAAHISFRLFRSPGAAFPPSAPRIYTRLVYRAQP